MFEDILIFPEIQMEGKLQNLVSLVRKIQAAIPFFWKKKVITMGKMRKRKNKQQQPRQKKRKRSMMTNHEIALDNLKACFFEAEKEGITVAKSNYRSSSYETYFKACQTMFNDLAKIYGENHKRILPSYMNGKLWDDYFEDLAIRYEEGTIAASTIKKRVNALEAFRKFFNSTNVAGDKTIRVGNKEERLDYLKDKGIVVSKDEVTAMKPKASDVMSVHSNINTNTEAGQLSLIMNQIQVETGSRIKALAKLQVEDIDFKKCTIRFKQDKNNFTRTVSLSKTAMDLLKPFCEGKKGGAQVFSLKDSEGNDMSVKKIVKTVQRYTNAAAKAAGVNREDRRYTTHSNRKHYAQRMYDRTRTMTTQQLQTAIRNYVKMQGSNKEGIVARINRELDRINRYRLMNKLPKKGFTREQLRRMLVSLHLGHSRLDVLSRYVNFDKYPKK